jgi:CheY-like chemotaxis protein
LLTGGAKSLSCIRKFSMYKYKKVIIVDDSKIERYIGEVVIKKSLFAESVLCFEQGAEALGYLASMADEPAGYPDMIFVDIMMPEMGGFDFLDKYARLPDALTKKCSVMLLSSTLDMTDKQRAEQYPFVKDFLMKPLMMDMLTDL